MLRNTAEAADSSPRIPAILRQCFTNWLFRNLGAFQESSSATFLLPYQGRLARDPTEMRTSQISRERYRLLAIVGYQSGDSGKNEDVGQPCHKLPRTLAPLT